MKETTCIINKIILTIGKKEISLSLKEARELHEALNDIFQKKIEYIPNNPIVIERFRPWWDRPYWGINSSSLTTDNITYSNELAKAQSLVEYKSDTLNLKCQVKRNET